MTIQIKNIHYKPRSASFNFIHLAIFHVMFMAILLILHPTLHLISLYSIFTFSNLFLNPHINIVITLTHCNMSRYARNQCAPFLLLQLKIISVTQTSHK